MLAATRLVPTGRDGLTARGMLGESLITGRGLIVRHRHRGQEYRHAGKVLRIDRGMVTIIGRSPSTSRGHPGTREAITIRIPDIDTVAWRPAVPPIR